MGADAIILLALTHNPAAHLQRLVSRTNMLAQENARPALWVDSKQQVTNLQKIQSVGPRIRVAETCVQMQIPNRALTMPVYAS